MTNDNPLTANLLRKEVDLAKRAGYLRDELIPEAERRLKALKDGEPAHPDDTRPDLERTKGVLEGQARACERVVDALDGGTFVLQELSGKLSGKLEDDVLEQSVDFDVGAQTAEGTPKQGWHRVRAVQLAMVDAPEQMPSQFDYELDREVYLVGDLYDPVVDYFYDLVIEMNEAQEVPEMGNLSDYGLPTADA